MHAAPKLEDSVTLALQQNPYIAGRKLRFETSAGKVVLHGTVASYFQKQMAQESLRSLAGVEHIENHLEVSWA
jgi:osmotically-inducible protein OsmY